MSVDKSASHRNTLALIADKLSIERSGKPESTVEAASPKEVPTLPPASNLEMPPMLGAPAPAANETVQPLDTAPPPPPPIPPAPPPPRIEPFAHMAPVTPAPKPVPAPVVPVAAAAAPASIVVKQSWSSSFVTTLLPIVIALFSLGLSVYQGMLFRESIDVMQRNVARGEYARTCREIIETYFQIKPRIGALMPTPDRGNVAGASRVLEASRLEAQAAIAKFGGLGTYLANFQDAGTRARYTELTKLLSGIYDNARNTPVADINRVFAPADRLFSQMNDDCARLSRAMGL